MKKIAIGQAGGPTSVVNSTLAGFVKETMDEFSLTFILNGYKGLVENNIIEGTEMFVKKVLQYEQVPGACLGSGRYPMTEEEIYNVLKNLKNQEIKILVFIGGDGTMEALHKIDLEAKRQRYDLQVLGLPKTVDNDIGLTDHAPGFGSAARYIATATRDLSYDLYSMRNFEQVRVIETMGRNAGWLAAASGYFKKYEEDGPHYIALPEKEINKDVLLSNVTYAIQNYGYAVVVVSEGVKWRKGYQISKDVVHGREVLGGISKEIQQFIIKQTNVKVRTEVLGMAQRSFAQVVSNVDQKEAYLVGSVGGKWIKEEISNVMVSLKRSQVEFYNIQLKPVTLKDVALYGERLMPSYFIEKLSDYYTWLDPIIDDYDSMYPRMINNQNIFMK